MRCRKWNERISCYVDGELGAEETRALEDHVLYCRRCAATLEEARGTAVAVRRLPWARAPEGLAASIIGGIEAARALPCSLVRSEMGALADGELDPARQRLLRSHLALCGGCEQSFATTVAVKEAVRQSLVPVRAPRGLVSAIFAATTRPAPAGWLRNILFPRRIGYAMAGAAVAAVLIGLIIYLPRGGRAPSMDSALRPPAEPATGIAEVVAPPSVSPEVAPSGVIAAATPEKPREPALVHVPERTPTARPSAAPVSRTRPSPVATTPGSALVSAEHERGGAGGSVSPEPVGVPAGTELASASVPAPVTTATASPVAQPAAEGSVAKPTVIISVTARAGFDLSPSRGGAYSVSDVGVPGGSARRGSNSPTVPPLVRIPF